MKLILHFLLCTVVLSCQLQQPSEAGKKGGSGSKYHTTPPSLLFFKNVRSGFYPSTEQSGTRITFYTLNRCNKQQQAMVIPYIASDWLNDRAYLMLASETSLPLIELSTTENAASISWPKPDPIHQTDWWIDIYQRLTAGEIITVRDGTGHKTLDEEWASCVKTTIKDYLRLTDR